MKSAQSECVLASDSHKRFKRKAREPRRLFHCPEEEEEEEEDCNHTQTPHSDTQTPHSDTQTPHSDTQTPHSHTQTPHSDTQTPHSHTDIPHWPTAISQPLCSRLRLAPRSSVSSSHQELCLPPLSKAPFRPQYEEELEDSPSPTGCVRLGPGAEAGGHGPEVRAMQQTRRLLANARERTRVHTISAAFEALRKQVPCYSYGQKLSKLAILRIACNYILSLAQLADCDFSSEQKKNFSHCVEQCTHTLQAEGRSKKKKMERMLENV